MRGGEELHHAFVGDADHADLAGRPWLVGNPLDHGGHILARQPGVAVLRAKRRARPTDVDRNEVVAVMDQLARDRALLVLRDELARFHAPQLLGVASGGAGPSRDLERAPVGRRVQHSWQLTRHRLAVFGRVEHVDRDAAAVPHR